MRMVALRDEVVKADETNGDVQAALQNLRNYVMSHMNTNLRSKSKFATDEPPIQLVNQYNRAVAAAQEAAATATGNQALYLEAEASCKARQVPLTATAQCIQDYVAARSTGSVSKVSVTVPKALYTYDFVSPKWSPDLAGWSVVLTGVLGVLLMLRIAINQAVSHLLREQA